MSKAWLDRKQIYNNSLSYIKARKEGRIKSFKTPWYCVNNAGVDGFEWHNMILIGGRSGAGKTVLKDQILREIHKHNKGERIQSLDFSLEMYSVTSTVREFSSILEKSYKHICSAENNQLSDQELNTLYQYAKKQVAQTNHTNHVVEKSPTVELFMSIIYDYMETHMVIVNGKKKYVNTIISLDHSLLITRSKRHGNKTEMLSDLGEAITLLKRVFPITFIILSQLARDVESPERNENGRYSNYILPTDIYGGDALFQHADIVIGLNRPGLKNIDYYGPDRYIIDNDNILVLHFLKVRNGDPRMSFMLAEFEKMIITEMPNPPGKQNKLSTI